MLSYNVMSSRHLPEQLVLVWLFLSWPEPQKTHHVLNFLKLKLQLFGFVELLRVPDGRCDGFDSLLETSFSVQLLEPHSNVASHCRGAMVKQLEQSQAKQENSGSIPVL